jgi:hypothetical protein
MKKNRFIIYLIHKQNDMNAVLRIQKQILLHAKLPIGTGKYLVLDLALIWKSFKQGNN